MNERRKRLRRKVDRMVVAGFALAEELWLKHRARCVTGYLFFPLTADVRAERVEATGKARPYKEVGSLVDEADGAALDGRATRWSIVADGHGAASLLMGRSTEDLVGLVLTRSDRGGVTLHQRTLVEAAALDMKMAVPDPRPLLSQSGVRRVRRELRRDSCFPATAFGARVVSGAGRRGQR